MCWNYTGNEVLIGIRKLWAILDLLIWTNYWILNCVILVDQFSFWFCRVSFKGCQSLVLITYTWSGQDHLFC